MSKIRESREITLNCVPENGDWTGNLFFGKETVKSSDKTAPFYDDIITTMLLEKTGGLTWLLKINFKVSTHQSVDGRSL